jgi:hypothetical protein
VKARGKWDGLISDQRLIVGLLTGGAANGDDKKQSSEGLVNAKQTPSAPECQAMDAGSVNAFSPGQPFP